MRISDWSSDVCSSDLDRGRALPDVVSRHRPVAGAREQGLCPRGRGEERRRGDRRRHRAVRKCRGGERGRRRSEEHTSELQSLMRISYAVFCLKKKNKQQPNMTTTATKHTKIIRNTLSTN